MFGLLVRSATILIAFLLFMITPVLVVMVQADLISGAVLAAVMYASVGLVVYASSKFVFTIGLMLGHRFALFGWVIRFSKWCFEKRPNWSRSDIFVWSVVALGLILTLFTPFGNLALLLPVSLIGMEDGYESVETHRKCHDQA